jgi:thiosulfate/3-mercaptopyruvate sulfurtransferase
MFIDLINDQNVRIAEVDYDSKANYDLGHVPNAVLFDWKSDINDPIARNVVAKDACEKLLQDAEINEDTVLVLSIVLASLYYISNRCTQKYATQ